MAYESCQRSWRRDCDKEHKFRKEWQGVMANWTTWTHTLESALALRDSLKTQVKDCWSNCEALKRQFYSVLVALSTSISFMLEDALRERAFYCELQDCFDFVD